ncbi:MAG: PQQ-like beta-propeller repeat protein [Deltaproteobacteria bacterium]|nr:PQQ-like beta-propeller repeat protein [Deltaproteobacteria bacterium]
MRGSVRGLIADLVEGVCQRSAGRAAAWTAGLTACAVAAATPVFAEWLDVRWRTPLHATPDEFRPRQVAAPLVAKDGTLAWFATARGLVALDPRDGQERWRQPSKEPMVGQPVVADLPTEGTAAAWGPTLYAATLGGRLYAFNPTTGAPRWSDPVYLDAAVQSGLAADSRFVFASAAPAMLLAMDRGTGKPAWRWSTLVDRDYVIEGQGAPTVHGGVLYAGTATGKLVALSARDGALLWDATLELKDRSPYGDVDSTPVVIAGARDAVVVATSQSGGLCALATDDGHLLWRYPGEGFGQPTVVPGGILVASALGELHLVDWKGRRRAARKLAEPIAGAITPIGEGLGLVPSERGLDVVRLSELRPLLRLSSETGFQAPAVVAGTMVLAVSNHGVALGLRVQPGGGLHADWR